MNDHIFKCEEDLEAVILSENKDAFAAIINNDLYGVTGTPPDQNVYFHSDSCFDLFCIHVFELLAENSVELPGKSFRLSLFTGARWLVDRHKDAWDSSRFIAAHGRLDAWLKERPMFSFWCGDISKHIEFSLSRRKMLRFAQLLSKHNLFRLTGVLDELFQICNKTGHDIKESEVLHLLEPFREELKTNRIVYHSSYLIEMLHDYFTTLNEFVILFYTPSPKIADWKYLENMSSDRFKDLFYWAINFASAYRRDRYDALRPATTRYLKGCF